MDEDQIDAWLVCIAALCCISGHGFRYETSAKSSLFTSWLAAVYTSVFHTGLDKPIPLIPQACP